MQRVAERTRQESLMPQGAAATVETAPGAQSTAFLADFKVIRRNGSVVAFEPGKISVAMTKAFLAVHGGQSAASARVRELVERLTGAVVSALDQQIGRAHV